MNERDIKVSALILTYNHEQFIGQAIEGVLMQKTDFPYELVIAEDCSTDGTRDVIRRYCRKYPDRIRIVLNRHNIRARRTIVRGYQACRGQYMTLTDGDDYWTSPDKLQRQADFLDGHPDCTVCFHSVTNVWDDGSHEPTLCRPSQVQEMYTLFDILDYNFIPACSVMYRRGVFPQHPAWFFLPPVGDWPQHILHAHFGKIGYIDEPMAAYRLHAGGVHSMRPREQTLGVDIKTRIILRQVLEKKYRSALTVSLIHQYAMLAQEHRQRGNRPALRACVRDCLLDCSSNFFRPDLSLVKMLVHVYLAGPYGRLRSLVHGRPGAA